MVINVNRNELTTTDNIAPLKTGRARLIIDETKFFDQNREDVQEFLNKIEPEDQSSTLFYVFSFLLMLIPIVVIAASPAFSLALLIETIHFLTTKKPHTTICTIGYCVQIVLCSILFYFNFMYVVRFFSYDITMQCSFEYLVEKTKRALLLVLNEDSMEGPFIIDLEWNFKTNHTSTTQYGNIVHTHSYQLDRTINELFYEIENFAPSFKRATYFTILTLLSYVLLYIIESSKDERVYIRYVSSILYLLVAGICHALGFNFVYEKKYDDFVDFLKKIGTIEKKA